MTYLDSNNDFDVINERLESYYAEIAQLDLKCNFETMNERFESIVAYLVELCL